MKAAITLVLAAVLGAVASPVDHVIHRRFSCAERLNGYCHAPNVDSYCNGRDFHSKASQTCGGKCWC
ncbi:hypothetical protein LMH87_010027 [Akanthomyces muscarius]|uniref:Uncharacterized protein n=1 Tax=Akanthomyces muscarius TaxID=2231603 RepID=A0A9W8QCI3_AKAMU|nr:hypothetical protein LMH87_010027 [Akanthomyces muscarius]KAJ4153543.1 hypothetical protein LMH87_010027 [Akanthomyces muscarius]